MALGNARYVSSYEILDQVFRDTGFQQEIPWEDCLSWIGEALDLIECPSYQYIKKVTGHESNPNLDITNYRAELPCDIHRIEMIAVNGFPARYSGNTFHHLLSGACCGLNTNSSGADIFIDNFGNSFSPQSSAILEGNTSNNPFLNDITFDINNDFLTLSVKTGKVCIAYLAIPIDDRGFPMIPDDTKFKLAVRKYLIMMLMYQKFVASPDSPGIKALFDHAEREWCWYVGSAQNAAKMPDISKMESFKNTFLRLIPKVNQFASAFRSMGYQEQKRIH